MTTEEEIPRDGLVWRLDKFSFAEVFSDQEQDNEPARQWIAEALEDSRVCWISKSALLRFAERNSKLSFHITKLVGDRLTELDNRLSDVLFLTARGRLARVLLKIGKRCGPNPTSIRYAVADQRQPKIPTRSRGGNKRGSLAHAVPC